MKEVYPNHKHQSENMISDKEKTPIPKWVTDYHKNFMLKERTKCFKTCSKCGETKLIFKFSIDKRNLDGRTNICKACRSREGLKYYYHNRVKMLIQNREYLKTNKKKRSIYSKRYREKHKEYLKELASKWYLENKEAIKERNLKYYQENLEACQVRRGLWREKNKERIREYNREYKRKHKIASQGIA